jgi:deoxyadenosine/deoxycytidine kinase
MPVFTIDGSIGAGKSTILEYLHINYNLSVDVEPVQKWIPFLEKMYHDKKGAFEFQIRVWMDRCWIQPKNNVNILMERSPYFQKNVFVPASFQNKIITESENSILHEMYQKAINIWNPKGYIYLRANPDKCFERISKRSRECEKDISIEYLRQLHNLHEQAYIMASTAGMPIICIDVEGKTVAKIAAEVWNALHILGIANSKPIYKKKL